MALVAGPLKKDRYFFAASLRETQCIPCAKHMYHMVARNVARIRGGFLISENVQI